MPLDIVIGAQWGDEGKGRVVDLLSENSDLVARYNGGDNAGHTVTVGKKIYKLHVIPSGIIHPQYDWSAGQRHGFKSTDPRRRDENAAGGCDCY